MKPITPNHQKFIEQVANGLTQSDAYELSCGKKGVSKTTSQVKGCQLAKRYALQIQNAIERHRQVVERTADAAIVKTIKNAILTQNEVDAVLCELMMNEKTTNGDRLKAIDLYNKRFGSNEAIKQQIQSNTLIEFTHEIIGNTITQEGSGQTETDTPAN